MEILFRGKRVDNGKWVYGYYVYDYSRNIHYIATNQIGVSNAGFKPRRSDYQLELVEVIFETVGQYIAGLLDKNGKKIFEGDIVRHGYSNDNGDFYENGIVIYAVNDGAYEIADFDGGSLKRLTRNMIVKNSIEVIGNRWDNPELLKGGAE